MRVSSGYHIENNRIFWHNAVKGQEKVSELKSGVKNSGNLLDKVQFQCQDDPEAPFLRSDRFNKFLEGGLHVLLDYDFKKLPMVEVKDNSLSVPIDKPISLGEFGGKPTAMRIFGYGGLETCLGMAGSYTSEEEHAAGSKVSLFDRMRVKFPDMYSANERREIREKSCTIFFLTNLARGKMNQEVFDDLVSREKIDLRKELESLGFDLSKEFIVNGKSFIYKDGELKFSE